MIPTMVIGSYEVAKIIRDPGIYSQFPIYEPVRALIKRHDDIPKTTANCGNCNGTATRPPEAQTLLRSAVFSFIQLTQTLDMAGRQKLRDRFRTQKLIFNYTNPLTKQKEKFTL